MTALAPPLNNETPVWAAVPGRPIPGKPRRVSNVVVKAVVKVVVKKDIREISLLLNVLEHLPKTAGGETQCLSDQKARYPVLLLSQWESSSLGEATGLGSKRNTCKISLFITVLEPPVCRLWKCNHFADQESARRD